MSPTPLPRRALEALLTYARREPVRLAGAIRSLILLAVAFGLLSDAQADALARLAASLAALLGVVDPAALEAVLTAAVPLTIAAGSYRLDRKVREHVTPWPGEESP